MSLTSRFLTATLGVGLLLCTPLAAQANDGKVFSGALCVEHDDISPEIVYSQFGRAYNGSPLSRQTLICPVTHDAGRPYSWKVTVVDGHPTQGVECRGYSMDLDGNWGYLTSQVASAGTGSKVLNLGGAGGYYADGTYYLRCSVPARAPAYSGVASYRVDEIS